MDPDVLFNILKERKDKLFADRKLVPVTSKIWSDISNELRNKISPNSIYILLYHNRNEWQSKLKKLIGLSDSSCSENVSYDEDENSSSESISTPGRELFQFELAYDKYRSILPLIVNYKNKGRSRKYNVLKPHAWTDVINDEFLLKHKLPCNFIYKRAKVCFEWSQNSNFITFEGKCKEKTCGAVLSGWSNEKPKEEESLKILILTINTIGKEAQHTSKRPLKGEKRRIVGKQLANDLACNWRRKNVEDMEFGRLSPPNLYHQNTLRKTKQKWRDQSLGISTKDPVNSLIEFKHNSSFSGSIHNIGIDSFTVYYWSRHQIIIYKDAKKEYCRLSVDATGGLAKKITRTSLNLSSAYIFLYEAVISTSFGHLPVAQMLSEKQDTLTIWNWLANWKKHAIHEPNETVYDYSKALLGALTRAFCNGMSLKMYTETCFLILIGNKDLQLPKCYIRLDVAHIIKIFCRFKCFSEKKNNYLKEFYVRGLRLLLTTEKLSEFKILLESLLTVMLCETDGWLTDGEENEKSPSEKCREFILTLIKSNVKEDYEELVGNDVLSNIYLDDQQESDQEDDNENTSKIETYLNNIKETSYKNSKIKGK